ncbi:hypothetical protein [Streptomyces sp. SID5910]|uniref:hypothetical protein n=1 Tax=Streptomyces sp. SID5910 TaxID=2690312 RepID=UPI0013720AA6|nr:hypothetical protein [Streptomyces sp. SID5910]
MEAFEPERSEVRIPKTALDALAAALSVRTAAMRTWPDGIEWMYAMGTWDEPHVEMALMPGGEEVWLRMSTDRSSVAVWTIEQWLEFSGQLPGATPPE